ncbi:hypothetical protein H7849_18135 [Alloacidobacterium dinghuense]|uniref:IPT/TIG domain-containing protein n=1 Tax=Alloacidobacterium dinghuense TaxID=2763107 RepID=A0A7G8BEP3_9BACT|nr:hypothetical protein [Alloacidobacterium dinghuense]QNI31013.1 hypothetical protein H7849_18135 [Alloacidobacterium dinghuense]
MRVRHTFVLIMLALIMSAVSATAQSGYSYTTIDYPAAFNTGVFGINKSGQTSGTYFGNDGVAHAFICTSGKFTSLDFPKASRTFGFGINEAAWIVGYYIDPDNKIHGFLHDAENFSALNYPNAVATRAYGLNASGQIVGSYQDEKNVTHGYLNQGGKFTSIDYPNAARTEAFGINNAGVIVGNYSDDSGTIHGFVDKAGVLTSFDFPGAQRTNPYGVNESGQIVGSFSDHNKNHGFINSGNVHINYPGALSTFGFAFNDSAEVVGQYVDEDSVDHGFLAVKGKEQAPQISLRLDPDNITSGVGAFKLTVRGIGFVPGSILQWNGMPRSTMFQDSSHLIANIEATDVATPNVASLVVVNPGPNGSKSNAVAFVVHTGPTP